MLEQETETERDSKKLVWGFPSAFLHWDDLSSVCRSFLVKSHPPHSVTLSGVYLVQTGSIETCYALAFFLWLQP